MKYARKVLKKLPLPGVITRVDTTQPLVALTFDDGPDPESTLPLLDLLGAFGARATFFMRGSAVAKHREVVRRAVEMGHAIGNHTWSHPVMPRIPRRDRLFELRECQEAIEPYVERPYLFRPPYLAQSKASRLDALFLGLEVIMCSIDSGDWRLADADEIVAQLLANSTAGDIVLLHDAVYVPEDRVLPYTSVRDRRTMLDALERYLVETGDRFRFVTVPELLRAGRPVRREWYAKGPAAVERRPSERLERITL